MIKLRNDTLTVSFPDVHPLARFEIDFQRTLRIPDDGKDHFLPPGLGCFPVRLVDDYLASVPPPWVDHGGVMLPMYQSEALWIHFDSSGYPIAVKVAAGKINAVTGEAWLGRLQQSPQDYMVVPTQPWIDGFAVTKGVIRQFVAMPLGSGYSAEEQLTGEAEFGGLQVIAYPMKREVYERRFPGGVHDWPGTSVGGWNLMAMASRVEAPVMPDMGLAPGGKMRQEIFDDPYDFDDWDVEHSARCFVHLANSMVWHQITGGYPPTVPPTAKQYSRAGLPWFDYYDDSGAALPGSDRLAKLKSVLGLAKEKGDNPLPENESVEVSNVVEIRRGMKKDQVREGRL
jgi:hypothetical protein